jgi:tRNA threonylcarbamoyladenosine biosynthesis protein TsaB
MEKQRDKSVVLAVETSGRRGSVAVGIGDEVFAEKSFCGLMRHSSQLFPAVQTILAEAGKTVGDVEHIYIGAGPGSFTGLRIAVTVAKMMAFANRSRIVAANTMDVIAFNVGEYMKGQDLEISRIATILDAKRKQFYVATFKNIDGELTKATTDFLISVPEFIRRFGGGAEPIWLLGEGLKYYKDAFTADGVQFVDEQYWPARARGVYSVGRKMAKAGRFADAVNLVPFYLRRPEAVENREKKKKGK